VTRACKEEEEHETKKKKTNFTQLKI